MAYSDDYNLAVNETWRQRVVIALKSAAIDVAGEAGTAGTIKTKRHDLAVRVLNDSDALYSLFRFAVVADGAVTLASTDAQIKTRISAVWNDHAGVLSTDT